jgi:hypothetical protein
MRSPAAEAKRKEERGHGPHLDRHRQAPSLCYTPGSCRGRHHPDRQPFTLENTAMCPAGPTRPLLGSLAGGQSHSTHDTVIRPGPHSCPFWQRSG